MAMRRLALSAATAAMATSAAWYQALRREQEAHLREKGKLDKQTMKMEMLEKVG